VVPPGNSRKQAKLQSLFVAAARAPDDRDKPFLVAVGKILLAVLQKFAWGGKLWAGTRVDASILFVNF